MSGGERWESFACVKSFKIIWLYNTVQGETKKDKTS